MYRLCTHHTTTIIVLRILSLEDNLVNYAHAPTFFSCLGNVPRDNLLGKTVGSVKEKYLD